MVLMKNFSRSLEFPLQLGSAHTREEVLSFTEPTLLNLILSGIISEFMHKVTQSMDKLMFKISLQPFSSKDATTKVILSRIQVSRHGSKQC
jgi:hypothetical protein